MICPYDLAYNFIDTYRACQKLQSDYPDARYIPKRSVVIKNKRRNAGGKKKK